MLKALVASSLLIGALTLPAAADPFDMRVVGGGVRFGYETAGGDRRGPDFPAQQARDYGRPGPDFGGPRADWRLIRSLRYRGYDDVQIMSRRPDVAVVNARAGGRAVVLVVDARSGDILRQRPAFYGYRPGGPDNDGRRW